MDAHQEEIAQQSLRLHLEHQGKLSVHSKVPVKTREDLSLAYTPGVAHVCKYIAKDEKRAYSCTLKHNTIAIITDGTAVLGLGNIGPTAAIPVMEGKAILFKEKEVRETGRASRGVKGIDLGKDDTVVAADVFTNEDLKKSILVMGEMGKDDRAREKFVRRHVIGQWDCQIDDHARHELHRGLFASVSMHGAISRSDASLIVCGSGFRGRVPFAPLFHLRFAARFAP